MIVKLNKIAYARSGDKGAHSNVGVLFENKRIYNWALKYLTESKIKKFFKSVVKGDVIRYRLDNIYGLNFILKNSLSGGGSESMQNDAQGKTYGQAILMMEVDIPKEIYNEEI